MRSELKLKDAIRSRATTASAAKGGTCSVRHREPDPSAGQQEVDHLATKQGAQIGVVLIPSPKLIIRGGASSPGGPCLEETPIVKNFAAEQMKVVKSLPASQDGGSPLCRRSNENGVGKFALPTSRGGSLGSSSVRWKDYGVAYVRYDNDYYCSILRGFTA